MAQPGSVESSWVSPYISKAWCFHICFRFHSTTTPLDAIKKRNSIWLCKSYDQIVAKNVAHFACSVYWISISVCLYQFLSATEYHSDADYNSRRVGVVVVVVAIFFKKWIILCFDQFASYLVGSCTRVRRFTSYPIFVIRPLQPAQPAYRPISEKHA